MFDNPRYRAKMATVEVAWRLRNSRPVVVGPAPRLVLALRARKDVELLILRVDFPEFLNTPGTAESLLAVVPHVTGQRVLKPTGEPWVDGQEDIGVDLAEAGPVEEVRWHGATVEALVQNVCKPPFDFWVYRGRVSVPRGFSVGLIVRADRPTTCRAKLSGE